MLGALTVVLPDHLRHRCSGRQAQTSSVSFTSSNFCPILVVQPEDHSLVLVADPACYFGTARATLPDQNENNIHEDWLKYYNGFVSHNRSKKTPADLSRHPVWFLAN
jgi:hypothetical protein